MVSLREAVGAPCLGVIEGWVGWGPGSQIMSDTSPGQGVGTAWALTQPQPGQSSLGTAGGCDPPGCAQGVHKRGLLPPFPSPSLCQKVPDKPSL